MVNFGETIQRSDPVIPVPVVPVTRELAENTRDVAGVLVTDFTAGGDIRIVAASRVHQPNEGLMVCPGGKIECGETPEQAARREFTEETGVELSDQLTKILTYPENVYFKNSTSVFIHWYSVPYSSISILGDLQQLDPALSHWKSYSIDELEDLRPFSNPILELWRIIWNVPTYGMLFDVMIQLGHYEEALKDPRFNKRLMRRLEG
jgi:8-oxo-dGTP pyrophosphatase MutT (NUDIX family)